VSGAYSITLVSAFVPLAMGLYWIKANSLGALFAVTLGAGGWQFTELYITDPFIPPTLVGLGLSIIGMLLGVFLAEYIHGLRHHRASHRNISA
jgi:Na+/pantothenate symporter